MNWRAIFRTYAVALTCVFIASATSASTSVEYEGVCQYVDAGKKVRFSGRCQISYGIVGVEGKAFRYILTFPNKNEVTVFIYPNGLATVNQIPAKTTRSNKRITAVTGEDEVFVFSEPSKDLL
jgi:hypothetical protein